MLSGYFTLSPKVESVGSYYVVQGISLKSLELDLKNNFGTSVIFSRLITRLNARSFKIHKFFMVEFAWILDHLTNQKNKRTVDRYYVGIHKYKQLYDEVKTKTWLETTYQTFPSYPVDEALKEFTLKPFPDQRDFLEDYSRIKYGFQLRGCLLDAAVGSGKTFCSLVWSKMISKGKLFVIVPKGLVYSPWVKEINNIYKKPPKVWTSLDGTNILDHVDAEIFIIHKEPIRTESWELAIKTITKNGQLPAKVIVDECHNYNEHSSQQTKGLIEFCSHPYISDVLFMSGTPIKAQGKETFALFVVIDKFFDKQVRDNFLKMYGRDNTFLNEMLAHRLGRIKYTIPAITTMEAPPEPEVIKVSFPGAEAFTLNNIRNDMLTYITDRVKFYKERMDVYKEDWLIYVNDFKERRWSDQTTQARIAQYIQYVNYFQKNGYNNFTDSDKSKFCANVEKEIESYLKGEDLHYFRHIKSAVKYVGLKIRGEALGNVLGKARMNAIKETIRHANLPKLIDSVKKKTLVYTSYVEVIKELEDYFKEVGLKSVSVYGNNSTEIDKVISQLADDPDTNPLITTFQTLREGKPMLMASQIILMNSPFRSYELTQTIARVHRRGQDEKCYVYLIDLDTGEEENITSRSIDILEWSREQVEQLLGGGKIPGVAELGVNTTAIDGMEQAEYIWDIPTTNPLLDIPLDVVEAVPSISLIHTSISDVF